MLSNEQAMRAVTDDVGVERQQVLFFKSHNEIPTIIFANLVAKTALFCH
jgi:hypothetical protein